MDDTDCLETISIDEASGQIAVSGGSDIFVYRPNGFKGESLKVRVHTSSPTAETDGLFSH